MAVLSITIQVNVPDKIQNKNPKEISEQMFDEVGFSWPNQNIESEIEVINAEWKMG